MENQIIQKNQQHQNAHYQINDGLSAPVNECVPQQNIINSFFQCIQFATKVLKEFLNQEESPQAQDSLSISHLFSDEKRDKTLPNQSTEIINLEKQVQNLLSVQNQQSLLMVVTAVGEMVQRYSTLCGDTWNQKYLILQKFNQFFKEQNSYSDNIKVHTDICNKPRDMLNTPAHSSHKTLKNSKTQLALERRKSKIKKTVKTEDEIFLSDGELVRSEKSTAMKAKQLSGFGEDERCALPAACVQQQQQNSSNSNYNSNSPFTNTKDKILNPFEEQEDGNNSYQIDNEQNNNTTAKKKAKISLNAAEAQSTHRKKCKLSDSSSYHLDAAIEQELSSGEKGEVSGKSIDNSYKNKKLMKKLGGLKDPENDEQRGNTKYLKLPRAEQDRIVREVLSNKKKGICFKDTLKKYGVPTPTLTYWIQRYEKAQSGSKQFKKLKKKDDNQFNIQNIETKMDEQ